jgi:hypothetical protein
MEAIRQAPELHHRERQLMKKMANIVGVLMMLAGVIWFLQGINILPGSFMTGQIRWAVYGAGTAFVGLALVVAANRRGA